MQGSLTIQKSEVFDYLDKSVLFEIKPVPYSEA